MPDSFKLEAHELARLQVDLAKAAGSAQRKALSKVRHHTAILLVKVKAKSSKPRTGPPGPRIQTGDYNRQLGMEFTVVSAIPTGTVGTNAPQGRRLELGFVGEDSLGRHYDQPPYPHFGPALDEVAPGFEADMARLADL